MRGVVGLTGYARSGKDTVADVLVNEFGYVKLPFAQPLKEMAKRIDPIIGYEHTAGYVNSAQSPFDGKRLHADHAVKPVYLLDALTELGEDETKSRYPEYRRFLQRLGTNGIRHVSDGFWIERWLVEALALLDEGYSIVVPDVRFPNEAQAIREVHQFADFNAEGTVARVSRAGLKNLDPHESEKHVGNMGEGHVIANSGALFDLQSAALTFGQGLPWA